MMSMTSLPLSSSQPPPRAAEPPPRARRLVLLPAQESGRGDELVRRYRLARLRLEPRETRGDERFTHLKHSHD
jgi:hypothetical protein